MTEQRPQSPGEIWKQMLMADPWFRQLPIAQQLRAEGHAKGRAEQGLKNLLCVLESRGVAVNDRQWARLGGCADPEQIDVWFDRALSATNAAEVFDAD